MCQMNACGVRERFYAGITEGSEGAEEKRLPPVIMGEPAALSVSMRSAGTLMVELILQIYVSWRAEIAP